MALDATKLSRIGGGLNSLWHYDAGADTAATVTGSGYFNAVTDQLRKGDVIFIVGNTCASIDSAIVTSATGAATVTTTAVEGVTAT
jgi:uncharacterized phosphosugar-binding protein